MGVKAVKIDHSRSGIEMVLIEGCAYWAAVIHAHDCNNRHIKNTAVVEVPVFLFAGNIINYNTSILVHAHDSDKVHIHHLR